MSCAWAKNLEMFQMKQACETGAAKVNKVMGLWFVKERIRSSAYSDILHCPSCISQRQSSVFRKKIFKPTLMLIADAITYKWEATSLTSCVLQDRFRKALPTSQDRKWAGRVSPVLSPHYGGQTCRQPCICHVEVDVVYVFGLLEFYCTGLS